MVRSETFEISIDWRPERRPLTEWRYESVPTEPPPSRTRIMAAVHDLAWKPIRSRRLWDRRSRAPANPDAIQVCSCSRFTRLVLVQLIFLVTDR